MTTIYFDTSALIKKYVLERGSEWVRGLIIQNDETLFVTSLLTMPEVYSAFARRHREGSVSSDDYQINLTAFQVDSNRIYQFIELSIDVVISTRHLIESYGLRANDSVQLATAVIVNQTLTKAGLSPLTFLSADDHLIEAAKSLRLNSSNPNYLE